MIEASHPRIIALAKDITQSGTDARTEAILIHNWVRDKILFGLPSGFYETSATETLDAKVGYCNTKVSLFMALLRARSIPCRMRMMDLSAMVLLGLFDPGSPYVDHAVTEVFLESRWIKVDSYVVDKELVIAASKKLTLAKQKAGFGIHLDANPDWDGRNDNFIQCLDNQSIQDYVLKDHGLFEDVNEFYQKVHMTRNRKTLISGFGIRIGHIFINRDIQNFRVKS